jgi:hypothetical protein
MLGFPGNHIYYVRKCYNELITCINENGIYIVCGSPGIEKTIFIINHMKTMMERLSNSDKYIFWFFFFLFFFSLLIFLAILLVSFRRRRFIGREI